MCILYVHRFAMLFAQEQLNIVTNKNIRIEMRCVEIYKKKTVCVAYARAISQINDADAYVMTITYLPFVTVSTHMDGPFHPAKLSAVVLNNTLQICNLKTSVLSDYALICSSYVMSQRNNYRSLHNW